MKKINEKMFDVCIVGLGPAGIGTALTLSNSNLGLNVLCLEAGTINGVKDCSIIQHNICKKEKPCSVISGFGGASLLGGHKVSTYPAGSEIGNILGSLELGEEKLNLALKLLNEYVPLEKPEIKESEITATKEFFENNGFEFRYYDSYICNRKAFQDAYNVIKSEIKNAGMIISQNTELIQVYYEENRFKLIVKKDSETFPIYSKYLVLGIGRLGQNFLKTLNRKIKLGGIANNLEIGVRLEFPSNIYPEIDKYHKDLKLLYNDIRTFCVCKEGKLAPYYLNDLFILDGYYDPDNKTNFTNLAIMLRLKSSNQNDEVFNQINKNILEISSGMPIRQNLLNYLNLQTENETNHHLCENSFSYWVDGNVNQCFPEPFSSKIMEGVHKFISITVPEDSWGKISVFAPAIEYSWPKFPVKSDFTILPRMYLIGDCTGRFRGILQALCSGIIAAESIIEDNYE